MIGSGVTGVEFVHMFSSFGAKVTLVVSRQQVLPGKDPEVAAVLEDDFLRRGVSLLKGARATAIDRDTDTGGVVVRCDDGRVVRSSHAVLAIGSVPNSDDLGLEAAGVETDGGYVPIDHNCVTNVGHIYAAGDVSGKLPLSSVAAMQGRKIAERLMGLHHREHRHLDYDKAASAIFTEPEIADVGLAEAEAFSVGRKIRVTKVPFTASPKALINNDPRGFVKIISDPATGVVLGGSIVGRHAAELISVIALAVTANLKVSDIVESLLVHPALSEALAEAVGVASTPTCVPRHRSHSCGPMSGTEALYSIDGDDVAAADGLAGGDLDLLDRAGLLGGDLVLHLHRLEHDDAGADLDLLADLDEHLDDRALHRHRDVAAAGGATATAGRRPARGLRAAFAAPGRRRPRRPTRGPTG